MCEAYVASGLPPDRFWTLTLRLYATEMRGAAERTKHERALVWWGAMMPLMKKKPGFDEFVGIKKARPVRRDWEQELAAWQTYAATRH